MSRSLRVGLLTGGGDAPGLNAVIRAVTKSLINHCNAEVIGFEDGATAIVEASSISAIERSCSGKTMTLAV